MKLKYFREEVNAIAAEMVKKGEEQIATDLAVDIGTLCMDAPNGVAMLALCTILRVYLDKMLKEDPEAADALEILISARLCELQCSTKRMQ